MRNKDATFLKMAYTMAQLSTCARRSVGCILTDVNYRIIGSGYNGVPAGVVHCIDKPCRFHDHVHGSSCFATHAETNAIAQCQNVSAIHTVFTTSFPCIECFKLIMNTGCKRIVFDRDYPATRELVEELNASRTIEFVQLPGGVYASQSVGAS